MADHNKQTAILIFANSSVEELKNKPFTTEQSLFNYFNNDTLRKVRKTKLPYILYSEKDQVGCNFAERFTNAIEDLFNQGYEHIITLGNDCPFLTTANIITASKKLVSNEIVIGPSMDGGLYLMGLSKATFNKQFFLNLPWQTSKLAKVFVTKIAALRLTLHSLKYLKDIDTLTDLTYFFRAMRNVSLIFKSILLIIFKNIIHTIDFQSSLISEIVTILPSNKGSPSPV